MDADRASWGKAEWQAYALVLEKAHQNAVDGWEVTDKELEDHSRLVAELSASNERWATRAIEMMSAVAALPGSERQHSVKRGRGRPRKYDGGISDLELFEVMKSDYLKEHPEAIPKDKEVIEWNFALLLEKNGLRKSRLDTTEFKRHVKTFQNRLSNARYPLLPKKSR